MRLPPRRACSPTSRRPRANRCVAQLKACSCGATPFKCAGWRRSGAFPLTRPRTANTGATTADKKYGCALGCVARSACCAGRTAQRLRRYPHRFALRAPELRRGGRPKQQWLAGLFVHVTIVLVPAGYRTRPKSATARVERQRSRFNLYVAGSFPTLPLTSNDRA
jgi:hypothetical protein